MNKVLSRFFTAALFACVALFATLKSVDAFDNLIVSSGGSSSLNLQQVTNSGSVTTNSITTGGVSTTSLTVSNTSTIQYLRFSQNGSTALPLITALDTDSGFFSNGGKQWQFVYDGATKIAFDSQETQFSQNVLPLSSATFDIGSPTGLSWRNGSFTNLLRVTGTVSSTALTLMGTFKPEVNNLVDIGSPTSSFQNIYASGTAVLVNVTGTGANIDFPTLGAPAVTSDIVCWTAVTGRLRHQATNCTVSSQRFKDHIESLNIDELMDRARKLNPVIYQWKKETGSSGPLGTPTEEGFIAEEVARIDPYLVVYEKVEKSEAIKVPRDVWLERKDGIYIPRTVDYSKISVILTGAIQDIDARLSELENSKIYACYANR